MSRCETLVNLLKPYTQMFSSDNTTADIFNTSCFGAGSNTVTNLPRVGYIDSNGSFIADGAANRNYSTVSSYLVEKGDYLKLKNWYVGAITNENSRNLTLNLSFLEKGQKYMVKIFRDAPDADWKTNPYTVAIVFRNL